MPIDVFSEAQGLQRRRALLEALQQGAARPNIVGNKWQALGQLAAALGQSYAANQGLNKIDEAQALNEQRYNAGLADAMQQFMQTSQGEPGMYELPPGVPGPQVPAIPGDPRAAIAQALTSRFPEMRKLGSQVAPNVFSSFMRREPQTQSPTAPQSPAPPKWQLGADGLFYRTNPQTGELETMQPPASASPRAGGAGAQTGRSDPANVLDAKNFFRKQRQAVEPKGEFNTAALSSMEALGGIREALSAFDDGAQSGQFEPFFQGVRKLGNQIGMKNADATPTDQLNSALSKLTFSRLGGKLGAGFSNADRDFVRDMTGSINTDPVALRRVMALEAALAIKAIQRQNEAVDGIVDQVPAYSLLNLYKLPQPDVDFGDPVFNKMVENALAGRETIAGLPQTDLPRGARNAKPSRAPSLSPGGIVYRERGGG